MKSINFLLETKQWTDASISNSSIKRRKQSFLKITEADTDPKKRLKRPNRGADFAPSFGLVPLTPPRAPALSATAVPAPDLALTQHQKLGEWIATAQKMTRTSCYPYQANKLVCFVASLSRKCDHCASMRRTVTQCSVNTAGWDSVSVTWVEWFITVDEYGW